MKEYQVNVRTDTQLENLKLYATSTIKALSIAQSLYSDYKKHNFIKTFKIISIIQLRKIG